MKTFMVFIVLFSSSSHLIAQSDMFRFRQELRQPLADRTPISQGQSLNSERKSPVTAVLYSLLIPGLGEWYVDRFDQGKYSLIAEGGLWLSFYSYRRYGQWIQDDSRSFAAANANAQVGGKNDQYFVDLGNFNDTYEYNDKKLIDRTPERLYDVNAGYYWKWNSESNRREFRTMRVSSEKIFNNSKFIVGAVIVNHIVSAVNAARLARQYNKELESGIGSWWFESSLIHDGAKPDGVKLTFLHAF